MRRIRYAEIVLGEPLAFDCYDEQENFLLQKGQNVTSERQLESLVARGFALKSSSGGEGHNKTSNNKPPKDEKSPFGILEHCKNHVRALFSKIKIDCGIKLPERVTFDALKQSYRETIRNLDAGKPANFQEQVLNVCKGIQDLCKSDADATLGAIHLGHVCRYTTIHPLHKAVLSELVTTHLGFSRHERLSILAAALTANISILDMQELLHARKEPLSKVQMDMIRLHPQLSAEMLLELGVKDNLWMQTILQHHERANGGGYPCGLKGTKFSRDAQILALADIYSAMITPRAYRDAIHAKEILRKLFLSRDTTVDGELVQTFIKVLGIYPPGSFVKLQNGESAIVTRRKVNSPTTPMVRSVIDAQGVPLATPISRDTAMKPFAIFDGIPRNKIIKIDSHSLWDYMAAA